MYTTTTTTTTTIIMAEILVLVPCKEEPNMLYNRQYTIYNIIVFQGALTGSVTGFVFNLWISIGSMTVAPYTPRMPPVSIAGCPAVNASLHHHHHHTGNATEIYYIMQDNRQI